MSTFLITGGSGFIGSSLADELLAKGHHVINIDEMNDYYCVETKRRNINHALANPHYTFIKCDICDLLSLDNIFKAHKIDYIVHLAARAGVRPSIEDPLLYEKSNSLGTTCILEMAKKHNIKKIVLASSSSVYGNNKKIPFSESDSVDNAISPYAATKKANEVMGHVYHALYSIDMIFLRFFTVYGPRQRPDLAIHKFVERISKGKPIDMFGDGDSSRDYTYIGDIIDGILRAIKYLQANAGVYEIINLGNNHPVTLSNMILTIEKAVGRKAIIRHLPMQLGDVDITYADIKKASSLLGYKPKTSFAEGIKNFFEWYKSEGVRK